MRTSQTFQSLMQHSDGFETFKSELAQSGSIRTKGLRVELLNELAQTQALKTELSKRNTNGLNNITLRQNDPIELSLICNTAYEIGPTKV
jgi:hypothetical protein